MAKSKFPHGFEPITKKLRDSQIIDRLKKLCESTTRILKKKTSRDEDQQAEEDDCVQEDSDVYRHLLNHLLSSSLLENTNTEILILLACCIANTFGILSPEVPTDNNEKLKEILLFFIRQLSGLSRPTNDLYPRYLYLLECISAFNIFDLALELADDSSLILKELIKASFNVVKENQGSDHRSLQSLLITQCSQLLQRVDQITNPVIDAIFYFLVPPQKFVNRESYRMAREFILKNQSTLEPYIQMFLNHGISESELPDCNLITERSILSVVFELHEFAPEIVYPIFGSVVSKLKSEDVVVRKEIVKLLGLLFGSQRSRLAEDIPELWTAYMARFNDINEDVRLVCVNLSLNILIYHPELRGQVSGLLAARCHDINDGVRLESVTVIRKLALTKFEALNEDLLNCLAGRIRDKKAKVRHEAIRAAAAVHKFVYVGEQFTESEKASVGIIMMRILNFYYQPFLDDRLLIERLFVSDFVPFKVAAGKRMRILFDIFMRFSDVEIRSFEEILSQQSRFRRFAREIFQTLEEKSQNDAAISSRIQVIAESYSTPSKIAVFFQKFIDAVASDGRLLKLLRYVFGYDYKTEKVENALVEILQRMKDNKQLSEEVISISVGFLERYAPLQFDASAIEELLSLTALTLEKEVSVDSDKNAKTIVKILKLLQIVADNYAQFFSTERIMLLFERIIKYNNDLIETSILKILSSVSYPEFSNEDTLRDARDRLIAHLNTCALNGCPSTAKFAVRCIVKICGKENCREILETIVKDSVLCIDLSNPRCATAIKALGSCCSYIPLFIKENFGDILTKNAAKVVQDEFEKCGSENPLKSTVPDKFDYYKIHYGNGVDDECLIRIFGMRLLCDFLFSLSREKIEDTYLKNLVNKTLKIFERILRDHGELASKSKSSDDFAGHIRLTAGCCIIKLASIPALSALVTADQLVLLGSLVNDELRFVRRRICGKLVKHLNNIRLPVEYMGLFVLIPLVKEDVEFFNSGTMLLEGCILRRKKFVAKEKAESIDVSPYHKPEYAVAYGLYVLAKQDTFLSASDLSSLREMRECLWFLISAFHRKCDLNSLAQILALLEHIKLLSDANAIDLTEKKRLEQNKKIWALADIGILMLSYRIPPFPSKNFVKLRLSKRFYISGPSDRDRTYLPSEIIEEESKRTMKRKRNFSCSSAIKSTVTNKSKNICDKEYRNKRTLKKQFGHHLEEKCEENIDDDEKIQNIAVKKVNGEKTHRFATLYEGTEHGFEEEAPSRSPSLSSIEEIAVEPTTSHVASSTICHSKKHSSAEKLLQQMNGISPILPAAVSNLKMSSRGRVKHGFLSSTPLTRCTIKKRIFKPDTNIESVFEECESSNQKKRKLQQRMKTKTAKINSQNSGETLQKRPSRGFRQLYSTTSSLKSPRNTKSAENPKKKAETKISRQVDDAKGSRKSEIKSPEKKRKRIVTPEEKTKMVGVLEEANLALKNPKKNKVMKETTTVNDTADEELVNEGGLEDNNNKLTKSPNKRTRYSRRSNTSSRQLVEEGMGDDDKVHGNFYSPKKTAGSKTGTKLTGKTERASHLETTEKTKAAEKSAGRVSKTRSGGKVVSNKLARGSRRRK